jgi:hypothetical protein
MSKKKPSKPYWEMTTEELREATKEFDDPNYYPPARPAPPEETEKLHRAMRKRGRPKNGLGAKTVALTVERGLLERSDRFARKNGISRSQLVAQGLKAILSGKVRLDSPKRTVKNGRTPRSTRSSKAA